MPNSEIKELIQAKQMMNEGKIRESFQLVLELEKGEDLTVNELISCKFLKANFFYKSGRYTEAIAHADQIIQESRKSDDLILCIDALMIQAFSNLMLANITQGERLAKQAEDLFKEIKGTSTKNLKERESFLIRIIANIYSWKGELQHALELNQKAFELAEGSNDKELTSASLINMAELSHKLRNYNKAKMYAERAIKIGYQPFLGYQLGSLIDILLDLGEIENAKMCFQRISKLREKDPTKLYDIIYRYYKALLLKLSLRAKDRVKSEKLFNEIINREDIPGNIKPIHGEKRIFAIINLCDLLLIELRITNYPEIIDEIQPYIQKLLDFSEQQHSYWILCETYLLQAKLSLLTFDIKKAKRFLTQAKQISERFDLTQLSTKIAEENEELLKKEYLWEKLREDGAPMSDRFALARLDEHIEGMVRNPAISLVRVTEEKVAIHKEKKICLVCRGDVLRFTYICECGAIYCENCARALTNLENVCWVCENPIDYSKPVKSYNEELEEINVDIKRKK